jgi:hypothetical protein
MILGMNNIGIHAATCADQPGWYWLGLHRDLFGNPVSDRQLHSVDADSPYIGAEEQRSAKERSSNTW